MRPHLPHQQVPGKFLASSWRTVLLKSAPRARFQVDRKPPAWLTGRPGQIFTCLWERVLRFLRPTTNRRVEGGAMNHRPYRAPFHALSAILLFLICVPVLRAQNVITCSSNNGKRNFCSLQQRAVGEPKKRLSMRPGTNLGNQRQQCLGRPRLPCRLSADARPRGRSRIRSWIWPWQRFWQPARATSAMLVQQYELRPLPDEWKYCPGAIGPADIGFRVHPRTDLGI
jgi:hypothetical protein